MKKRTRCEINGKVQYSEINVKIAVSICKRKRGKQLYYYICPWCGCYHLTHKNYDKG